MSRFVSTPSSASSFGPKPTLPGNMKSEVWAGVRRGAPDELGYAQPEEEFRKILGIPEEPEESIIIGG